MKELGFEEELVLLVSRWNLSGRDTNEARRLLQSSLDWNRVFDLCLQHRIYPLAYRQLSAIDSERIPIEIHHRFKPLIRINAFRNLNAAEELTAVLSALNRRAIPAIPLKGLRLSHTLYKDISLRVMADTDILVPPQFDERALEVLRELGYKPRSFPYHAELRRNNIESELVKETLAGPLILDLHWAILHGSQLEQAALEDLWSEARQESIFGATAFRMSPEWLFLFLAGHAAKHGWNGLKWLADIHDLCAVCEIDWGRVMKKATALGWVTIVQATFVSCNTLFGTRIPVEISWRRQPRWLILFPAKRQELSAIFLPLRWLNGTRPKLRYLWFLIFAQKFDDWRYARYLPRRIRFLYTPVRLVRVLRKYGPQLLKRT